MASSYLYAYDKAVQSLVYNRYKTLLGLSDLASTDAERINQGVIIMPKGIALREVSEKRGDDYLSIPFMNVYRTSTSFSWDRNRSVVSRRGINVAIADNVVTNVKAVPMDLAYGVWFWSQDLDLIYQCIENYSFWQHDNPKIEVVFDGTYTLDPEFHFAEVLDESEIEQIFAQGKYFVYRMPIQVDSWVLKYDDDTDAIIEKIRLSFYDKDEVSDYDEIIVEDSNQDVEMEAALRMLRSNLFYISDVDVSVNTVSTPKDRTSLFSSGDSLIIENSTDNNDVYIVSSVGAVYDDVNDMTIISLEEPLSGSTVDGNIYKHE